MSVWGGLLSPVPMSTAGDALGIWLDKPHPWWLLPSFQDACLSPTLLAWILLLLNLLLSAHDNIVTRATYKATQLLSFSPWPWHTSLYLQYLQPPSDLLSRGPDPLGFELSILKYIYIYMFSSVWQRSHRLSLKLYHCFHYCLLFFFTFQILFFLTPRRARSASKGQSCVGMQSPSSTGAAARGEGQQDGCDRAHTATALN